jgi:hypothetical protein
MKYILDQTIVWLYTFAQRKEKMQVVQNRQGSTAAEDKRKNVYSISI